MAHDTRYNTTVLISLSVRWWVGFDGGSKLIGVFDEFMHDGIESRYLVLWPQRTHLSEYHDRTD